MAHPKPRIDAEKIAIALQYRKGEDEAPKLVAKGKGYIAERILELAREHGIEIRKDEDLAVMLEKLDVDMPIPVEAYMAVAEILSYIYQTNAKKRR